jgi:gliding motility associated protien GldN
MRYLICVSFLAILFHSDVLGQQKKKKKSKVADAATTPSVDSSAIPQPAPAAAVAAPPLQAMMDSIRISDSIISASGYDPLSVRKVHVSDVMYKMQVWRVMDLREKCNRPFLAKGNEITKAICDAVFAGKLVAYSKDSLSSILTIEQFKERLSDPESVQKDADGNPIPGTGLPFMPDQLYTLKFKENLLFDKQRSRFYYDIQSITLFIPAEFNTVKGTEQEVASFRYTDVARAFKSMPSARWYNSQNRAEDKRISDAMDLRLFCSRILKISNPRDQMIEDMPEYRDSPRAVLVASQKYEYELVAKENEVWDY